MREPITGTHLSVNFTPVQIILKSLTILHQVFTIFVEPGFN